MKANFILTILMTVFYLSCNNNQSEKKANENVRITVTEPADNAEGSISGRFGGCGYNYTPDKKSISIYQPRLKELDQINSILKFSGLSQNFEIYSANIENAIATIIDNKRYILYDPNLLAYSDEHAGNYWSSMSILAHEIGHHLSGHTLTNKGSNPSDELEADKYSGFVLYKLGASIEQAIAAMQKLGSENDSYSHPSKYKRIQAITEGWNEAAGQRYESAVPPPPADDNNFGEYGFTEFTKERLISQSALSSDIFGGVINSYNHPILEGIIIDVTKEDPSGGGRTSIFNELPSNFNMEVTIQFTKVNPSPFKEVKRKVGDREKFHLLDYYQMSRIELGWLEALMVPGRKIRFRSFYFGYGGEDIFYIKKLNRNGTSERSSNVGVNDNFESIAQHYVVNVSKAYFYSTPDFNHRRKAYLVYGEIVSSTKSNGEFIYVNFTNVKGQTTSGWISKNDLQN